MAHTGLTNCLRCPVQTIWKDDRWQPCGIQELLTPANIKKKYRRAIVLVHPDKQKGKEAAQVMLAERVFERLKVRIRKRCAVFHLRCSHAPASEQAIPRTRFGWRARNWFGRSMGCELPTREHT